MFQFKFDTDIQVHHNIIRIAYWDQYLKGFSLSFLDVHFSNLRCACRIHQLFLCINSITNQSTTLSTQSKGESPIINIRPPRPLPLQKPLQQYPPPEGHPVIIPASEPKSLNLGWRYLDVRSIRNQVIIKTQVTISWECVSNSPSLAKKRLKLSRSNQPLPSSQVFTRQIPPCTKR